MLDKNECTSNKKITDFNVIPNSEESVLSTVLYNTLKNLRESFKCLLLDKSLTGAWNYYFDWKFGCQQTSIKLYFDEKSNVSVYGKIGKDDG